MAVGADEKTCPMCAEAVKAAAVRCRFCGYDFTGGSPLSRTEPSAPAVERKAGGFSCVGVIIGLAIVGFVLTKCGSDLAEEERAQTARNVSAAGMPGLKVTAGELFRAYQENEASAQSRYGGRILDVSGTVQGIDLDLTDDPVIQLETDNQFMPTLVNLIESEQPKAASLTKGQAIVVRCAELSEIIGSPTLRDCAIIR